jgi:hypothetical protein
MEATVSEIQRHLDWKPMAIDACWLAGVFDFDPDDGG